MTQIRLTTNAAAVVAQLTAFPQEMLLGVARALDQQNELTVGAIQRDKLSQRGPLTLGVRTNRLRSSVRPAKAIVTADGVVSSIGSNVKYAGVHEYGSTAVVQVPAHTRQRPSDVLGRSVSAVFNPASGKISRTAPRPTGPIQVKAHQQRQNFPARRYIGRTIEERGDAYSQAISAAVLAAWNGPATP
jgi:phage gpG-like protein